MQRRAQMTRFLLASKRMSLAEGLRSVGIAVVAFGAFGTLTALWPDPLFVPNFRDAILN